MGLTMRRRGVRLLGLAAVVVQGLVAFVAPYLVPVVVGTVIGGVAGVRLVARDPDGAVLRLGIGFLASLLGTGIAIVGFSEGLLVPAAASSILFGLAWWQMQLLARDDRRAWGATFRERVDRRPDEESRSAAPPPPRAMPGAPEQRTDSPERSSPPAPEAGDAWWEELD